MSLGHCWPIFMKFHGGKAAASFIGTSIFTSWLYALMELVILYGMLKKFKIMSISVLVALFTIILGHWVFYILIATGVMPSYFNWLFGYGPTLMFGLTSSCVMTACYIIIFYRHKENIKRLINHEENKVNIF